MAKTLQTGKKPIEQFDHKGKKRINNPPVGLVDAKSDAAEGKKTYAYDPHLDPTLVWAGKGEIDATLIEACRGTASLAFAPGKNGRIAVKIVDDRGIGSLKVLGVS